MNIGILSFKSPGSGALPEEIMLKNAAIALGHKARILRVAKCQLIYNGGSQLFYNGKKFPQIDVLIPRASILTNVMIHLAVLKQFQFMKIPVLNRFINIGRAKNKLWTLQYLHHKKIPIPKTVVLRDMKHLDMAIQELNGPPVILKNTHGSYGNGVVIGESKRAIASALDIMMPIDGKGMVLMQEYVKEAKGRDRRIFIVGGKVVGAMERRARRGEFRANLELGGLGVECDPTEQEAKIAIRAAKVIGLEIAGVDVINGKNGPSVLEVNANPGFKGLQEATGINIADTIIRHAVLYASAKNKKHKPDD